MNMLKMLFPKMWLQEGEGDPGSGTTPPAPTTPPESVKIGEVEVPMDQFEKIAREKYKDHFDAYDNREKWQTSFTQRDQQLAEHKRKAALYDRLASDPNFMRQYEATRQPTDVKSQYLAKMQQQFPDVDPRFFESQFDLVSQMTGQTVQQTLDPFFNRHSEEYEERFLASHPLVQKGSEKYNQMIELIEQRYKPEHAYQLIYGDEIKNKEFEDRVKARDEDNRRKLTQSRVVSQTGQKPKAKTFREHTQNVIDNLKES